MVKHILGHKISPLDIQKSLRLKREGDSEDIIPFKV